MLGVDVENLSPGVRAKRGERLPVVLSMPETIALLEAMSGTPRLMAALIYGGGLRVSECCELRIKDIDFDQGLVFVRSGKGDKDQSTLLAEVGRDDLRAHLREAEAQHHADRRGDLPACGCPMPWTAGTRMPAVSSHGCGCFPSKTLSTDPRADFQEYLGQANVETTMIYTHVVKELRSIRSPEPARTSFAPVPLARTATGGRAHPASHLLFASGDEEGAPVGAIQELAGHADLSTTQRSMHLSPAATEDAIRLLDSTARRPQCRAAAWRHCGDGRRRGSESD